MGIATYEEDVPLACSKSCLNFQQVWLEMNHVTHPRAPLLHSQTKWLNMLPPLFFLSLCPFSLKKLTCHMTIIVTHAWQRRWQTFYYQKHSDLCFCQQGVMWCTAQMKMGKDQSNRKSTISKRRSKCLFNITCQYYQRLGNSVQKLCLVLYLRYSSQRTCLKF